MEMDLSPKLPQKIFEGDGGSYYGWMASDAPILADAKVGAGKLVLEPLGLAPPHYADSAKVVYVLQGTGLAGLVLPGSAQETVVRLKKGLLIAVPTGAVSWWYNDADEVLSVVFLGVTPAAHRPGEFTYFLLAGAQSLFTGFSTQLLAGALCVTEREATKLFSSQPSVMLVKAGGRLHGLEPSSDADGVVALDLEREQPAVVLTGERMAWLEGMGLSATRVEMDGGAVRPPAFVAEGAAEVVYVARGSGRVEVVGAGGRRAMEARVEEGCLFVVPRFFAAALAADAGGMECLSIVTAPKPERDYLMGKGSVMEAISPQVLQPSLNVTPDLIKLVRTNRCTDAAFLPPPN